ncbi:hypothetical protein FEM03_03280 [Phragmitibacter flavus]|uniref:DUF883 domain-containing protein n=1 Tax=Phragmitibacter flavus TaxID=2576071 RepID=A0A5R8KJA6_9BACT|nr:hypothetical protein [Phragmitibacter flavus]TLD72394.1 hypothetical protein FEM03_03280 [Phragmitibacter flavus]
MNESPHPDEDMISEGGPIQQAGNLPGSAPLMERGEAALMKAKGQVRNAVNDYYKPHPFRGLLVALGAGVLIGLALDLD